MVSYSFLFVIVIISSLQAILHYRCIVPRIHFSGPTSQLFPSCNCRHITISSFVRAFSYIVGLVLKVQDPCLIYGRKRYFDLVVLSYFRTHFFLDRNFRLSLSPNQQRKRAYLMQFEFLARHFLAQSFVF